MMKLFKKSDKGHGLPAGLTAGIGLTLVGLAGFPSGWFLIPFGVGLFLSICSMVEE